MKTDEKLAKLTCFTALELYYFLCAALYTFAIFKMATHPDTPQYPKSFLGGSAAIGIVFSIICFIDLMRASSQLAERERELENGKN